MLSTLWKPENYLLYIKSLQAVQHELFVKQQETAAACVGPSNVVPLTTFINSIVLSPNPSPPHYPCVSLPLNVIR